jgi:hypothetical protein
MRRGAFDGAIVPGGGALAWLWWPGCQTSQTETFGRGLAHGAGAFPFHLTADSKYSIANHGRP